MNVLHSHRPMHSPVAPGRAGRFGYALIAALLLLPLTTQAEQIYKWVDENGVTHFSAQPPVTDDYQQLNLNTYTPAPSSPATSATSTGTASSNGQQADDERLTEPGNTITVDNPEKIAENCARARQNIETIQARRRVVMTDENGNQRRLGDEERMALLNESQQYLERWCDD
ncbi:MAG: DUF4124 domain-containing protein [Wenzhouxiangellaceae bacterium]